MRCASFNRDMTYIKGKKLQPLSKVTDLVGSGIDLLGLVQKQLDSLGDGRLILDQLAHGEGIVDRSAEIGMVRLVHR